jgi:capsular exopolysaccharide synthesis family protein
MTWMSELDMANIVRLDDDVTVPAYTETRVITVHPRDASRLVFQAEPDGLPAEQYKMLRHRLCSLHPRGGVMLITSPNPGAGKSLTSTNLAWCLADSGHQTCLVDLDFRAPGIASLLGYTFEQDGVEEVLTGKRTIAQSIRRVEKRSLYVLGITRRLTSPGHLLAPTSLSRLLNDLRTGFRWVIVDCAPVIPMSDVAEISPHADGALLVVRSGKTDRSMIAPSLEIVGAKLWGVVFNDTPIDGSSYFDDYGKAKV